MLSDKQVGIKYQFLSLWYDSTWVESLSTGPLANTQLIKPIAHTENILKSLIAPPTG